jgi:hypothetical protein
MADIKLKSLLNETIVVENNQKLIEARLLEIEQMINEGRIGNFTMGVAMAIAALFGANEYMNSRVETALINGDPIEVKLKGNLTTLINGTNTTYTIKVDSTQSQPIKVDTSKNIVTLKSTEFSGRKDLIRKVKDAVREVDPSLASRWMKNTSISVK